MIRRQQLLTWMHVFAPHAWASLILSLGLLGWPGSMAGLQATELPGAASPAATSPVGGEFESPLVLHGSPSIALASSPAAARGQSPASSSATSHEADSIEQIIRAGREHERAGEWGEALSLYQEVLRLHPDHAQLRQRRAISRIHFELARRYADSQFVSTIRQSSRTAALNLYSEVLLKIDSYHVDQPNWDLLARHGLASLEIAINDPQFRGQIIPSASDSQIRVMVDWLRNAPSTFTVNNRQDAYLVASNATRVAEQRLGLSPGITCYEFISGAVVALDAYSSFLSQSQYGETMSQIEGNFVGLGVELKTSNNELEIVGVIPNGPAGQAGIVSGDKITSIGGDLVADLGSDRAADMLRGIEGSQVEIEVLCPDGVQRAMRIQRRRVTIPSVESVRFVDPESKIGYIRLTNFQKSTLQDFDAALWRLQREGMQGLIVDLRGNPGGLLSASVELADRFLSAGVIVSTQGRNPLEDSIHHAKAPGTWRVPLVVLIDQNSASASEIFAAAIADHQRGVVVGERSYGKGSVQGIFPLNIHGGGIRLTTAQFYSPQGKPISKRGVIPHAQVQVTARPTDGSYTAEATDAILRHGIQVARQQTQPRQLSGRN